MPKNLTKKCNGLVKRGSLSNAKRKVANGPPDPDGLFARAAARAREVIAVYDELYGEVEHDDLLTNLLHDLMHLSDRDAELGDVHEQHARASSTDESLVKESKDMVGILSYEEAFGRKAPR